MPSRILTLAFVLPFAFALSSVARGQAIDFSREILPILADKCFQCHGPDAAHREADLRLDLELNAKASRDGQFAIKAGILTMG